MLNQRSTQTIAVGTIGNILEWYDFAIYGYFAPAIGRTFFPTASPAAQVLSAFGIFAIGFLMRPIGGALIGQLGDRFGRMNALRVSILMMALPTCAIAMLPGYASIGMTAPIILTLLRMIQGLSLGGEFTTSMVFLVEHAPLSRRGLIGATACLGATVGTLLGSATGAAVAHLFPGLAVDSWAWRIPFAIGLIVGLVGLVLRQHTQESNATTPEPKPSLLSVIRGNGALIARIASLTVFTSVGFYVMFVYIVGWLQTVDGMSPERALEINTISMIALLPTLLFAGWASDHVGARPILLTATGLGVVASVPLFYLLYQEGSVPALLGQLGFVVSVGLLLGALPRFMVEETPVNVRCMVIALGYNLTFGIVGGLTPLVATWLVYRTENDMIPAFLIMAAAAVSLMTVVIGFRKVAAP